MCVSPAAMPVVCLCLSVRVVCSPHLAKTWGVVARRVLLPFGRPVAPPSSVEGLLGLWCPQAGFGFVLVLVLVFVIVLIFFCKVRASRHRTAAGR